MFLCYKVQVYGKLRGDRAKNKTAPIGVYQPVDPYYQRKEDLQVMKKFGVQPEGWAPFAEGLKGMFTEPVLKKIADKHGKTVPQVILRWDIQQGIVVIPKSVHKNCMEENIAVWDFELDADDMEQIAALDQGQPSMLDCGKPSEIDRLYDYLNNPVLTSL